MTGAGGDTAVPVVIRGAMNSWPAFSWTWEDWLRAVKVDQVKVRLGERSPKMKHPQWERFTKVSVGITQDDEILQLSPR